MDTCTLEINNIEITVPNDYTILQAAKKVGISIPTLCYHPDQNVKANCRICLVENDQGKLMTACSTPVLDGMKIKTHSKLVRDTQKGVLQLILANHDQNCLRCSRNGKCELQKLCEIFNISKTNLHEVVDCTTQDLSNHSIIRDQSKCIKCNRCVEMCQEVQTVAALSHAHRSTNYSITPAYNKSLAETNCIFCGQCVSICPVGALREREEIDNVIDAIYDPNIHVIAQIAPAVRVSIGEEFGYNPSVNVEGKLISALKQVGFDKIFDTNFTADLTIIEEGHELISRLKNDGVLPMLTSCSPGWINFIEAFYPNLLPHLSSCKSPQQMFGALSKSYYSSKMGIPPETIFTVSIMPCTAKKHEAKREEMHYNQHREVDAVLTTRETAKLIKSMSINLNNLIDDNFDAPFGISSGAGAIFGASGGVMEAALRSIYELLTKKELANLDFTSARGINGIKEVTVMIDSIEFKGAVVNGLKNARYILEQIQSGECPYTFIEVMCCPGGCIGGGGQPFGSTMEIRKERISSIYSIDKKSTIRQSHKNPLIQQLYEDFLIEPNSWKCHDLLHTFYYPHNKE